jgi:hypothetical protein
VQCRPILRFKIISIPVKQVLYISGVYSLMPEMNILGAINTNKSKKKKFLQNLIQGPLREPFVEFW